MGKWKPFLLELEEDRSKVSLFITGSDPQDKGSEVPSSMFLFQKGADIFQTQEEFYFPWIPCYIFGHRMRERAFLIKDP